MPRIRYAPGVDDDGPDEVEAPVEKGPWRYHANLKAEDYAKRHFLESGDSTHDVRLYISGDFANDAQRRAYGEMLAERLNRTHREDQS